MGSYIKKRYALGAAGGEGRACVFCVWGNMLTTKLTITPAPIPGFVEDDCYFIPF